MARLLIVDDNAELASLIAAAAQSRGHVAKTAGSGEAAVERLATERFDLAVVDLVLPGIDGKVVLSHLQKAHIPSLAISGVYKGDVFAREATEAYGAAGYFEKPFQLGSLLDAVDRILKTRPVAPRPTAEEEDAENTLEELIPLEEDSDYGPAPFSERTTIWSGEGQPAPPKPKPEVPSWSKQGSLAQSPVYRLLNAYYEARHEGELRLQQGKILKIIYLEAGCPLYAASNLLHERFGQFCLRRGWLSSEQLTDVVRAAREGKLRTGDALVKLGFLTEPKRDTLLDEQVREIIWSTFGWEKGDYRLSPMPANRRQDLVKISVFPGNLILQGVDRTETLETLRRRMPGERRLFPATDPPYALYELKLTGPQALLVAHTDGTKTVSDLLALTDLNERDALATLVGLEWTGQLKERPQEPPNRRITFGL